MTRIADPSLSPSLLRSRRWINVTYALQGFNGAVILTNLPGLSDRTAITDSDVSLVILTAVVLAGVGSTLAGAVAPRRGSASVLVPGLALQGLAMILVLANLSFVALFPVFALYGLGIGLADAGNGMQAITVQRRFGRSIINSFYAYQTAAAIAGAILIAVVNGVGAPFEASLAIGAVVCLAVCAAARGKLAADPEAAESRTPAADARARLPWRGIVIFGLVVAAAFIGDSAATTWSTVFLTDTLTAAAWAAPLGYAGYQALVLVSRVFGDRVVTLVGRARVMGIAIVSAAAGLALVAVAPSAPVAILGFAVLGAGLGVMVPLSFSAAGDLDPSRTDEIIAHLNLFNYLGVLVGAGAIGFIADAASMRLAFAVPACLILLALLAAPSYRTTATTTAKTTPSESPRLP